MNQIAVIIVIISAVMHALWNLCAKKSKNKLIFFWLIILFSVVMFLPWFFYFLFYTKFLPEVFIYICLSGFLSSLHFYFLAKTYTSGDLSLTYPIVRSSSLFVFLLSIVFLKEQLSTPSTIGILTIVCGIYILHLKSFKLSSFFQPLKKQGGNATFFALMAALVYSIHIIVDSIGTNYASPFLYIYWLWMSHIIFLLPVVSLKINRQDIKQELITNHKFIIISGFFLTFSYALVLFAFGIDNTSQIISLRQLSIILGVILGNLILKEKYGMVRVIGAIIIFIGITFVALN
jgi:uncharacterized membrane protein